MKIIYFFALNNYFKVRRLEITSHSSIRPLTIIHKNTTEKFLEERDFIHLSTNSFLLCLSFFVL